MKHPGLPEVDVVMIATASEAFEPGGLEGLQCAKDAAEDGEELPCPPTTIRDRMAVPLRLRWSVIVKT
jgi:hypothetical protein